VGVAGGVGVAASAALWGPLAGLANAGGDVRAQAVDAAACDLLGGYGPLQPSVDASTGLTLMSAPAGFTTRSIVWAGDAMTNGSLAPLRPDGMGTFTGADGSIVLVRNHENWVGAAFGGPVYDPSVGGGVTTVRLDPATLAVRSHIGALSGTFVNCSGGVTPWGSWLSGEETVSGPNTPNPFGVPFTKKHGYVFEVPAEGIASGMPLNDMGRFKHEAAMTDPLTRITYLTEDDGQCGFYMFVPDDGDNYAKGGRLYMLAIKGQPGADLSGALNPALFPLDVEWVRIPEPDPDLEGGAATCHQQGAARGGATFRRLEGCYWTGAMGWFVSTTGGGASQGQIFSYTPDPHTPFRGQLDLLVESSGAAVMNQPDNLVGTPNGALLAFEDGAQPQRVLGVSPSGNAFPFLENTVIVNGERNGISGDYRSSETAGGCFSPDGTTMFFNVQTPGITIAVTGDWARGCL
jgi:secreted PhoX family phosphatase